MDYALIFITGFFASVHCLGMCGVIVLAYSTQSKETGDPVATVLARTLPLHLMYNGGRVLAYTVSGAIIGFLGSMLTLVKNAAVYVSVVSGIFMIISGIVMLKVVPVPSSRLLDKIGRLSSQTFGKLIRENSMRSKFTLGVLTPLFPCGMLYALLFKAGATQSLLSGGLTMLLFGSGMIPALVLAGTATSLLSSKMRHIGEKFAVLTIIVMGIVLVLRGLGIPLVGMHGSAALRGGL